MIICLIPTKPAKYRVTKLNKKIVETLLNELFTLEDQNENEKKMLDYMLTVYV